MAFHGTFRKVNLKSLKTSLKYLIESNQKSLKNNFKHSKYNQIKKVKGQPACTKSVSIAEGQSLELVERRLKWYAVMGVLAKNKKDHKAMWAEIAATAAECVPCIEDLNKVAPTSLPSEFRAMSCGPSASSAATGSSGAAASSSSSIVVAGPAGVGPIDALDGPLIPELEAVHARMLVLHSKGGVPKSTREQRGRLRKTPGETYFYPPELSEAVTHNYINPNLPAPLGYKWVRCPHGWTLSHQGG